MTIFTLPTVITAAGLQPVPPTTIQQDLINGIVATNPGYTANLPASLIEDALDTEVAGISAIQQGMIDAVNSLTPFGANPFLLQALGSQIYGVGLGQATNTSVNVVFTTTPSTPGFVIAKGFTISDGVYQYVVQDGGVIGASGQSQPLFAVATIPGSWPVAAGSVTNLVTSAPSAVGLTVTNPLAGTPATATESEESYRSRVLQAGLAAAQGFRSFLATQLNNVPGVTPRLVSVLQQTLSDGDADYEVIVGGGDPYLVAYAIYTALFNINGLTGSTLAVTGITNASPGVVTTNLNHGYATGQVCQINGLVGGMTPLNGISVTATVIDEKRFSIGVNTTGYAPYSSGGVVTPNLRNNVVTIQDYPDTFQVPFVTPPQQTVTMTVTWNTSATNFVSAAAVAQLANPALVDYVNSIPVGQPINLFELQAVFQAAVASVVPPQLLTRLVFAVSINGVGVSPQSGTGIIAGDPESYMFAVSSGIVINQG